MVTLLIVHQKKDIPDYYLGAIKEYSKRLGRYCNLSIEAVENITEIPPLVSSFYTYRVHVKGKALDSVSFSETLQSLSLSGHSKIAFVINMKFDSDDTLSLSSLTLSDELSVVSMLEQIYRAFRIWYSEPYHK
ncbi:23S rRNA (pseudouridine(1915)-N(3))-methyltransferase RlmH [Proteiniclasticum sp.]|uniref:23S rRNA (pseudouridine(1915)-N(3))-methyltransferase RlmH n=1 Tax=Proteiniclasticum sp. TaxID=2053595 RepID=UPI00289C5EA6|nr:23S rRNA (pseudouridine(1915)-N(3))-methyltransferase RlmH [Proteiniclasticum sp.]